MSIYIQARINSMIELLNADVSKLQQLMITMERLRDAENIDFALHDPLLDLEAAVNAAQKQIQQIMTDAGLKPTEPKELNPGE